MQFDSIVTPSYAVVMCLLAIYGVHRLWFLLRFRWNRHPHLPVLQTASLPMVTVQLPIFNERTVARGLIRAVGDLDYPHSRLELQILDDSSDETKAIVDDEAARLRALGTNVVVLRRAARTGFKAGALDHGLRHAKGDLVCVFDADFRPERSFLKDLVGLFEDPEVGMVQARWGHMNRDESLLTRAQSALLDGHFVIEHKVRCDSRLFFNFNGTAGIWRRAAIESAGGWEHDTLTEDLDLSYRAQLAGWRFVYASQVVALAEVPPDIAAFKSQQHRWAKGSVQVLRKLAPRILRSDESLAIKCEAFAHLAGNIGYPCVLLLALVFPLTVVAQESHSQWVHLALFVICTVSVVLFYERSQRALARSVRHRALDTLAAIVLGIGMCPSQTRAVLEGFSSTTGTFVRTPKKGDAQGARRYRSIVSGWPGVELLLAAWFAWAIYAATKAELWGSLPFLFLFFAGFTWVGSLSLSSAFRGSAREST